MENQLTWIFVFLSLSYTLVQGRHVVCYYSNWAQYRKGTATFVPENIDPQLCTHIIFAFAGLVGNRLSPTEWNDATSGGMYARINNLKRQNPSLKTLLAVGGWGMGVSGFTKMVASSSNRAAFATDTITYLRRFNFDGLDIDWEYPAARGSPSVDKKRFTQLVGELRKAFRNEARLSGSTELLLTAAVPAGQGTVNQGYEVREIARDLDFINLMSYDLHGGWEVTTGHNSPLYPRSSEFGNNRLLNIEWAANNWVKLGTPRSKLVIGMGTYGRSFRLASASNNGMGAPAIGAGSPGPLTQSAGVLAYYEVCNFVNNGWTRYWHNEHQVPYAVRGTEWVGYDDVESFTIKANWVVRQGFGGGMIWAIDEDDFNNDCGRGRYPLLSTLSRIVKSNSPPPVIRTTSRRTTTRRTRAVTKVTPKTCNWWCSQTTVARTTRPTPRPTTRRVVMPTARPRPTVAFRCPRSENGQFPDASDCSVFHVCVNGRDFRLSCGSSLRYNPKLKVCDYPANVNCY